MKKLLLLLPLLFGIGKVYASDFYLPGITYVTSAPTGPCVYPPTLYVVKATGNAYGCVSGAYTLMFNGGGGSGTVSSGSGYAVPSYSSGASTTVGPTNIVSDSTGNNLTVPGIFNPKNSNYAVFYADQFSGATADVKLNACIAAAHALYIGGICDARGLSNGNQFLAAKVTVVAGTTLIVPTSAIWIATATDGSATLQANGGSTIMGESPAGAGCTMHIKAGAAANLSALFKTDTSGGENAYVIAGNFCLENYDGGTVTYLADVQDLVDQSWIHDIFAQNYTGNVWHIVNNAFMTFSRIQGYGSQSTPASGTYSLGGVPLTFGTDASNYNQSVIIEGSTFNAPITGSSNVVLAGANTGITFLDDYFEGNGTVDTSTTMISIAAANKGIQFIGGGVNDFCASACAGKYAFTSAMTMPFSVQGMYGYHAGWINDTANSITIPNSGTTYTTYAPYVVSPLVALLQTVQHNGIATTQTDGLLIQNKTAATAGATIQYSPSLHLQGTAWNTSTSTLHDWITYVQPVSQGSPFSFLVFAGQKSGGGYFTGAKLDNFGDFYSASQVNSNNGSTWYSGTAPTISSGFNATSPSISANNGTAAFIINTGTGTLANTGIIALPGANAGWNCYVNNITASAANRGANVVQTASTNSTVTIQEQTTSTGAAVNFVAGDLIRAMCFAY